jgi:endonuclease/exonuclease/phosphatase family metal-dependent hydrolase
MKKGRKIFLLTVTGIILIPSILVILFLAVLTISMHRLPLHEILRVRQRISAEAGDKNEFTLLSWNIGYGGLGKDMDFFYEGGKRVKPEKEEFRNYLSGITKLLSANDSMDFIFIQEVDLHSKRSYFEDEVSVLGRALKSHSLVFAENYESRFVPLPVTDPMGQVVSGIASFTRFNPVTSERIGFGTEFSWPKQLFFLQRCFIVQRFRLANGKELVLVNTHNSTFDTEGELRKNELSALRLFVLNEFWEGNYVITGGDFNNNPLGFDKENIHSGDRVKEIYPPIRSSFLPGWKFAFDPSHPTNRDVDAPYQKSRTKTTIIDFFVLSPNLELVSAKTLETGFECSDHQPVTIKVRLKQL